MSGNADEIVQVPVPRRHLAVVYRALGEAMNAEEESRSTNTETSSSTSQRTPWTKEDIQRLRTRVRSNTVRTIMDVTSEQVGRRFPLAEIAERADRSFASARAELAGLSRLVNREFESHGWPVRVEQRPDGLLEYFQDSENIARWWREASLD
jgi:hypothetical protein